MIHGIKKKSVTLIKVASFALVLAGFTALNFSDLHHNFIRYRVASDVVEIINPDEGGGTGFHIKAKSGSVYIMTNKHICEMSVNGKPLLVKNDEMNTYIPRKIIYMSEDHDLCLMEPLPGKTGISLASDIDIGEKLTIAGHPQLRPLSMEEGELINKDAKVTIPKYIVQTEEQAKECKDEIVVVPTFFGMISVCVDNDYAYQAKLISYPGNSGSPVVNKYGNLVGVLFAGNGQAITDSYLVKLEYIKELLDNF